VGVGDLVSDYDGRIGIVLTEPRPSGPSDPYFKTYGLMEGDQYELVYVSMPWGKEQYATDELEVISESR
jgi:hypothetical protein